MRSRCKPVPVHVVSVTADILNLILPLTMTLWYLLLSVFPVCQFSLSSIASEESCWNVLFLQWLQEQFLCIITRSLHYFSAALLALATFLIAQILIWNCGETYWISWREMWLWKESASVTSYNLTLRVIRWYVNENGFDVFYIYGYI
jgi:hypothetical protein